MMWRIGCSSLRNDHVKTLPAPQETVGPHDDVLVLGQLFGSRLCLTDLSLPDVNN